MQKYLQIVGFFNDFFLFYSVFHKAGRKNLTLKYFGLQDITNETLRPFVLTERRNLHNCI